MCHSGLFRHNGCIQEQRIRGHSPISNTAEIALQNDLRG
jgi:hypothetical protein